MQAVPIGVPGEIFIGGEGLARGYFARPDLTAERFVPDPFTLAAGARLFRTGDIGRYLPDGQLEFRGRRDHQIKLRGFRIELGEIQSVLAGHPQVQQCVVVLHDREPGDKALVAYVAANGDQPATAELRSYLLEKLPDYMVPALFITLDAFPLTASGKIDRLALPQPDFGEISVKYYQAPETPTEEIIAEIWANVLKVDQVSVGANFFEVGGHSLLATQIMVRIRERFHVDVPLRLLFEFPTVTAFSAQLDAMQLSHDPRESVAVNDGSPLVLLQAGGEEVPFFFVHPVAGNVLPYGDLVKYLDRERSYFGFQAAGLVEGQTSTSRLEEMASQYVSALLSARPEGPYLLGGWSLGGVVAFEMAQQLKAQQREVEVLALIDAKIPIGSEPTEDMATLLLEFAEHLNVALEAIDISVDLFASLSAEQQLVHAFAKARELQVVPEGLSLQQFHRIFAVFRHNRRALQQYLPEPYSGHVSLFEAEPSRFHEPVWDWEELVMGGISRYEIGGNHFTIMREPYVEELARQLRNEIVFPGN
jgi:thioesterase domain-containing protein/acyl carrier protein